MPDYATVFRKNLYFCPERLYIRILDDEHDSDGVGEGVTIVSQRTKFSRKQLRIYFGKSHSSEKLIHNSTNPTSIFL
jgi:hypothetical protein